MTDRDNKIKLYGSPADKDNLEVGDEILDVNERKLEDLPRAEVIRYIHEVSENDEESDATLTLPLANMLALSLA